MAIFGIKREEVKDIRRRRQVQSLKEKKREEKEKKRLADLEARKQKLLAEGSLYEARASKKQAKQSAGFQWPILSTKKVKVRKKKQGRKLSGKRRIGLI